MGGRKLDMRQVDSRLAEIYTFKGDKQAQYDRWAEHYESDLIDDLGYVAHLRGCEIFARVVADTDARTLDLGCGTGLVGAALQQLGYDRVDGADFSARMLDIAAQRGVYCALHQRDITQPIEIARAYDALISIGLFSYGVPHLTDLHRAVACVAPGCPCVISVNGGAWREHGLDAVLREEARRHAFTVEEIIETEYIRAEGITAQVLVIRR
ncbi:MAG: class I SAM-dependent DNA methyltransferase [bacterium]